MRQGQRLQKENRHFARRLWGLQVDGVRVRALDVLGELFQLRVASGELILLDGRWYVTHSGLLRLARRSHCFGIDVRPATKFCDVAASRWAFKATVYKTKTCKGFVGYGDAEPSNVSPLVRGAEMRIAETRAVNRALRKAYGIGICSVEELGSLSGPREHAGVTRKFAPQSANGHEKGNGNGKGRPKLRDRLCLLIRQHQLDASLVKRFAVDFCAVPDLRQASREQVEAFITHIGELATKDPDGLVSKLNSYAEKHEGAGAA